MNQTQISVNHRQIGYRIKEVREQNHISQAQLAEMTDLSVSYISHIENAKRKASLESIIRIVNALGITIDELLAGVQMHNPTAYQTDIDILMEECSENEKRFIFELIKAVLMPCIKTAGSLHPKMGRGNGTSFSHKLFLFGIDYRDMHVRMVYFILI